MTPSNAVTPLSQKELLKFEALTHDLCNFMTVLLHHVTLLSANPPEPVFERLMIITGLVTKTDHTLKELLGVFGRIQGSATTQMKCSGETENEKGCSKRQGR
jgi:hypothetical protein